MFLVHLATASMEGGAVPSTSAKKNIERIIYHIKLTTEPFVFKLRPLFSGVLVRSVGVLDGKVT